MESYNLNRMPLMDINTIYKFFFIPAAGLVITLATLAVPEEVEKNTAVSQVECGLPTPFMSVDVSTLDAPLPWRSNCLTAVAWGQNADWHFIPFASSYGVIMAIIWLVAKIFATIYFHSCPFSVGDATRGATWKI